MSEIDSIWDRIVACEGETFHQVSGNPFTYQVVGKAIIPSRTPRKIPRSNFEKALALLPLRSTADVQHLQGPSYIYAILTDPRIAPSAKASVPRTGGSKATTATAAQPRRAAPITLSPGLSSPTMTVVGHSFALVGPLEPERDAKGAVKRFMPQSKYAKAGEQALNPYGQGPFCRFRIPESHPYRGVYALVVGNEVMYVGKCENLSARFNTGHGLVSPKNCYEGGQNTTCKINRLVLKAVEQGATVMLWFHRTEAHTAVEKELIDALKPAWNGTVKL